MDFISFFGTPDISGLLYVIGLTFLAGLAMPAGALLANVESIRPQWLEQELRHSIIAFGGGALLSAVALVLVPQAVVQLPVISVSLYFIGGGLAFMALDILLYTIDTPATQLMAMLSDFVPESVALGAAFAMGGDSSILLAGLIALQNLPEGFNAFRELLEHSSHKPACIILIFTAMALLGPAAGVTGYVWLSGYPQAVAAIMLLASGGILYSVFQDIAPQAKLEKHWAPPIGAVLGFCFGIAGHMLVSFLERRYDRNTPYQRLEICHVVIIPGR